MRLKPILFSTPMVQALLAGTKTQTRRITGKNLKLVNQNLHPDRFNWHVTPPTSSHINTWLFDCNGINTVCVKSSYEVGDILWVRETYCPFVKEHIIDNKYAYKANMKSVESEQIRKAYIKAGYPYKWKSSLYMPLEACRLFLELTSIRIERLQEITEDDAKAEGAVCTLKNMHAIKQYDDLWPSARQHYHEIWQNIHGNTSWDENPYVWVYTFQRVDKPNIPS